MAFERHWPPRWLERSLGENYWKNLDTLVYGAVSPAEADPELARQALAAIPRLRGLASLFSYTQMTDADVETLTRVPTLRSLYLEGDCSGVTDVGCRSLSRLTSLRHLRIQNPPITDAGLTALGKLPRLTWLSLDRSLADPAKPSRVTIVGIGLDSLTRLETLDLRSAALNGVSLRHLGRLKDLRDLSLAGDAIIDDDLQALAPLTNLVTLNIQGARIDGTGFRHLRGLTRLTHLTIQQAPVTDQGVAELVRLPALKSVYLLSTQVTTAGLQVLQATPTFTTLVVKPDPPAPRLPLDRDSPAEAGPVNDSLPQPSPDANDRLGTSGGTTP